MEVVPHSLLAQLSAVCTVLVCGYALIRGDRPERSAAGSYILALVATLAGQDRIHWIDPERRLLAIDVAVFVVFAVLTITTQRKWIIPATAFQLLSVIMSFVLLRNPMIRSVTYLTMLDALSYGVLLSLAWGTSQVADATRVRLRAQVEVEAQRSISFFGDAFEAFQAADRRVRQSRGRERALAAALRDRVAAELWPFGRRPRERR